MNQRSSETSVHIRIARCQILGDGNFHTSTFLVTSKTLDKHKRRKYEVLYFCAYGDTYIDFLSNDHRLQLLVTVHYQCSLHHFEKQDLH
jgi:hypothetical protein